MIIELHRHNAGCAGNIATNHEHHAELAYRVSEAQNGRGEESGLSERQRDAEESIKGPRA